MRQRGLLLMLVGLLAAAVAGLLVFYLSTTAAAPPPPVVLAPTATPIPVAQVVVAAHDIPIRQVVVASDVITQNYPVSLVPADAFHDISEVLTQTATASVFAGQVMLKRQFIAGDGHNGASAIIPAGKVLVAFPATDMLNATGAVQAGDHVDIFISLPVSGTTTVSGDAPQAPTGQKALVTQATMENVEVYSTGYWSPDGNKTSSGEGVKVITFVVDRQEALILKYIKDSGGTIDLAVRSLAENKTSPTDPVSLDYLISLYHFLNAPAH